MDFLGIRKRRRLGFILPDFDLSCLLSKIRKRREKVLSEMMSGAVAVLIKSKVEILFILGKVS